MQPSLVITEINIKLIYISKVPNRELGRSLNREVIHTPALGHVYSVGQDCELIEFGWQSRLQL